MFKYERYNFRIISLTLFVVAAAFLTNSLIIVGIIFIGLGIAASFSYQGIEIDPEQQQYLKYDRFLWIKIGKWRPYSTPSYITVVRINVSSSKAQPSPLALPDDRKGAKAYKVNLVVEGDERYVNICHGNLGNMLSEAIRLGKHLDLRVLDYTTHNKNWIL